MKTRQFWYPLPARLVAQHPAERRGTEKMMVLHRDTGVIEHRHIADIVEYITPNDLLVVNDTKVFPARLLGGVLRYQPLWKRIPELSCLHRTGISVYYTIFWRHARRDTMPTTNYKWPARRGGAGLRGPFVIRVKTRLT